MGVVTTVTHYFEVGRFGADKVNAENVVRSEQKAIKKFSANYSEAAMKYGSAENKLKNVLFVSFHLHPSAVGFIKGPGKWFDL